MPSKENSGLRTELKSVCENLKTSKNTCALYEFQESVEKCLEVEKKILNRDLIVDCLNLLSNLIPSKLMANLFKRSIEVNDIEMCFVLINSVQILEESQAVDCIKFFLREYKEDDLSDQSEENNKTINENLNLLFIKSYDYRLFTTELKKLSSKEFLYCLQYLLNYLKTSLVSRNNSPNCSQTEEALEKDTEDAASKIPSILQVVSLFCCFVDAHFTHITLSGKAQELIADALQLIETQLELYFEFLSIESLLKEYRNNKEFHIKNNNNVGIYTIECLKL